MSMGKPPEFYLARLRAAAELHGGELLSKQYVGDGYKMTFRCAKGHVFDTTPGAIKQRKWCQQCGIARQAASQRAVGLKQVAARVKRSNGTFNASDYVTSQVPIEFHCAKGHAWITVPNSIVQGSWCPKCAIENREDPRVPVVARRMEKLVNDRQGLLLPPGFTGFKSHMRILCTKGHEFELTPEGLATGVWCYECKEQTTLQRLRDAAAKWGGELRSTRCARMNDKLQWRCALGHDFSKSAMAVVAGGWCTDCRGTRMNDLRDLRRIARERGGECISTEVPASHEKARWRCAKGHEWESLASVVVQGHWCPECGRWSSHDRRRLTIAILRQTAIDRGGRCLSKSYVNSDDKLRWECAQGHRWTGRVGNIRQGSWCPKCAHSIRGTIEGVRAMATERGGRCLSRHWDDRAQPVEFACEKGHEFWLSAPQIHTGVWCPKCAPKAAVRKGAPATKR